jgi:hypothetical protein
MNYSCRHCGRTDFLTVHGLQKHRGECKARAARPTLPQSEASFQKHGPLSPTSMIRVPAWEKVGGSEHDSAALDPAGTVVSSGRWVVYAYASDYNSRNNTRGSSYYFSGSGRLSGRDLLKHSKTVIAHANKQGAERFFEFFKVARQPDGRTLIVMLFGS